jgi:hypothetical protein
MKNIILYLPKGDSYLEIGAKMLDKEKKETDVEVEKIEVENGVVEISLSDGNKYLYGNIPYSTQISKK